MATCTEWGAAEADRRLWSNGDDIGEDANEDIRRVTGAGTEWGAAEADRRLWSNGDDIGEDANEDVRRITGAGTDTCDKSVGARRGIAGSESKERRDCNAWTDGVSHAVLDANMPVVLARLSISSPLETMRPARSGASNADADFASLHVAAPVPTFSWSSRICTHISAIIFKTPVGTSTISTGSVVLSDGIDPIGVFAERSTRESCVEDESLWGPSVQQIDALISSSNAWLFRSAESVKACGV